MSNLHPRQRRSPRLPFDSLVRVLAFRLGKEIPLWGRSTDLSREGIGVTVVSDVAPEELVSMQVPLPSIKPINVHALVRYRNQDHCGFQFFRLDSQQQRAIEAACERLRKARGQAQE